VRADEFVEDATFVLARNPEYGTRIGQKVWFLPMWRQIEGRSLSLYYTFDADRMFLLSIQVAADDPSEE
jgi:hypothetical protein